MIIIRKKIEIPAYPIKELESRRPQIVFENVGSNAVNQTFEFNLLQMMDDGDRWMN